MDKLYEQFIANKQKAIVGAGVAAIGLYLGKYGVDIQTLTVADALQLAGSAVFGYVGVYVKRNK